MENLHFSTPIKKIRFRGDLNQFNFDNSAIEDLNDEDDDWSRNEEKHKGKQNSVNITT